MQWQATTSLDGCSGSESVTAPQLHLASPIGKVSHRLQAEISNRDTTPCSPSGNSRRKVYTQPYKPKHTQVFHSRDVTPCTANAPASTPNHQPVFHSLSTGLSTGCTVIARSEATKQSTPQPTSLALATPRIPTPVFPRRAALARVRYPSSRWWLWIPGSCFARPE